jgi:hypothetical protein
MSEDERKVTIEETKFKAGISLSSVQLRVLAVLIFRFLLLENRLILRFYLNAETERQKHILQVRVEASGVK